MENVPNDVYSCQLKKYASTRATSSQHPMSQWKTVARVVQQPYFSAKLIVGLKSHHQFKICQFDDTSFEMLV